MRARKVVLVTGASGGIGLATAEHLAKRGYIVYGGARRLGPMQNFAKLGGIPLELDVSKSSSMQSVVERIMGEQGRIDILVNNAGFGLYGSIEDTNLADVRYQFEVNVFGIGQMIQLVTPHMRRQGAGKIVNISSMGGKIYTPLGGWYHATKHAVEGLSDCLRLELRPFGIDVIVIEPGVINTNFGDVLSGPLEKRSSGGAYESLVKTFIRATKAAYETGAGSPPELIAKTIAAAIEARNPRTRYLVGKFAKPLVLLRRLFGDKIFDRIVMSQISGG